MGIKIKKTVFLLSLITIGFFSIPSAYAQITIGGDELDYAKPKEYEIGGVSISGVDYLDDNVLIMLSGLEVGERIMVPGDDISNAIKKLWRQGLFDDVKITASRIEGDLIFINIYLDEVPRLANYSFKGVRRSEADNLKEEINISRNDVVTDNLKVRAGNEIKKYFINKGYWDVNVKIEEIADTTNRNYVGLKFLINKNKKVKIKNINIIGNHALSAGSLRRSMKNTKEKTKMNPFNSLPELIGRTVEGVLHLDYFEVADAWADVFLRDFTTTIFKSSKFIESDFEEDKLSFIAKYNKNGFRDAIIIGDTIRRNEDGTMDLDIYVNEGSRYYFRDIKWVGNTKYNSDFLSKALGIQKGDVYNQEILDANLTYNEAGTDISSLYLDDGYLFFQVHPVEVNISNDSIDLEMRIFEGEQARINKIIVKGNNRTNDHVIMREIRTRPGQLFSRTDIIRTTRELAQLGYFNPEKINPIPTPNPADGTVDITYEVEEASSDQIELSGGWGYGRLIGTLGLKFTNFSFKQLFNKKAWRPVPTGDGQQLSLRFQTYGKGFINFTTSFTEPWLGGRKPNALSVSYYYSRYAPDNSYYRRMGYDVKPDTTNAHLAINGITVGLGKRLTWPDDFFTLHQAVSYQRYDANNYSSYLPVGDGTGVYNKLSYAITFARSSVSQPIYPRSGSMLSVNLELTFPYSLFSNKDYATITDDEIKFKWMEYHKWKIHGEFYKNIIGDLVLMARAKYGFLGNYNSDIGTMPFDRFFIGGDGMAGYYNFDGRELIGFRGYENNTLTANYALTPRTGATVYNKNTLEIRYPLSLNPSAIIYMAGFVEAGNSWSNFKDFTPFNLYRSAGLGVRVFLPMFGLLGLDWGYGFDNIPGVPDAGGSQFHFSIGGSID